MDVEVEHPHAHHRTGIRKLDLILPIAALFVSFVSIGIAYHHGHIMQELVEQNERLVQANSLPHLNLRRSMMTRANGLGELRLQVTNSGVGPADVRSVELAVGERPMRNPTELIEAFGIEQGELSTATITNRMIRPGETIEYFTLNADPGIADRVDRMIAAAADDRLQTRICYCSVFDECWTVSGANQRPRSVEQCPVPKVPYG